MKTLKLTLRRALPAASALCGALAFAGPAAAQPAVKPHMLVVFDTSGSMAWTPTRTTACRFACAAGTECYDNDGSQGCGRLGVPCMSDGFCAPYTFGDGSLALPGLDRNGNGVADDSRMFIAKEAMRSTLFAVSELEFGLMRYAQREGNAVRSTCTCEVCLGGCNTAAARSATRSEYDAYPFARGEGAINYDGTLRSCLGGG